MPISEQLHKERLASVLHASRPCLDCGRTPQETVFHVRTSSRTGVVSFKHRCAECYTAKYYKGIRDPVRAKASSQKYRAKMTKERELGVSTSKYILADSRRWDRGKGFPKSDLTIEFIDSAIASGCSYCGDKESRMTLDRVDNDKGHSQSNVVPACMRCNYARRDMPYAAWLLVAEGMRKAREQDLFGDWYKKCPGKRNS